MSWSATQYTIFEEQRTRPVRDLLAQVHTRDVKRAVDIGCGPANSTEVLRDRFPDAEISGIDSSGDMVAAARQRLPGINFELGEIGAWAPDAPFDVILANAVLQWVPDHATLLPALLRRLTKGGSLAVQIPDNLQEPAHELMRQVAADGPWASRLTNAARDSDSRGRADGYYKTLTDCGAAADVWRTTYFHPLAGGPAAVVEWFKGSALRPFLQPLEDGERDTFLARYTSAIAEAYPPLPDGTVLLPFPRLFFVARV